MKITNYVIIHFLNSYFNIFNFTDTIIILVQILALRKAHQWYHYDQKKKNYTQIIEFESDHIFCFKLQQSP